jgi:transcription antitermination factor NusG
MLGYQVQPTTSASNEPKWYAAYVRSRHEKAVTGCLQQRDIQWFLPLYSSWRKWSDRRVNLELPLLPGYVFVRIDKAHRVRVLELPSVIEIVSFQQKPAIIPEEDIEMLRKCVEMKRAEPFPYAVVGHPVRIIAGPFEGRRAVVVRKNGGVHVVVQLECVRGAISLHVDVNDLADAAAAS